MKKIIFLILAITSYKTIYCGPCNSKPKNNIIVIKNKEMSQDELVIILAQKIELLFQTNQFYKLKNNFSENYLIQLFEKPISKLKNYKYFFQDNFAAKAIILFQIKKPSNISRLDALISRIQLIREIYT